MRHILIKLTEIKYKGMQDKVTGEIVQQNADVLMNYIYITAEGTYKT